MLVLSTNQKGAIAETAITAAATRLGIDVYRPVAEGGRFDLIFGFATGALARVQCKWANVSSGAIQVRTCSARRTGDGMAVRSYTVDEIDALAAYCSENGRCYYLPATMVAGRKVVHLRLSPARNNQAERLNWAAEYELGAIAQLGERRAGSAKVVGSSPTSSIERPLV